MKISDRRNGKISVKLVKTIRIPILAEGIEKEAHIEFLRGIRCDYGQGYYFSNRYIRNLRETYLRGNYEKT
jgi:EAL domain-containing protein (putative c-di-GMP-specific phosphodiesterase class I)